MGGEITVGIDIGTSSVKALAVDADGEIVARARVPHRFSIPRPLRFEHDATVAWRDGPRRALDALGPVQPQGLSVAAMVPSLTAVDADGVPVTPGLLYGDERGHAEGRVGERGELAQFLRWTAAQRPDARGYWMAQAVANHALCGRPLVSTTVAATAFPLFDWTGWDESLVGECGARPDQMPEIVPSGRAVAEVPGLDGCALEAGTIDALGEQLVAGADIVGDVLVILGTTIIVWVVVADAVEREGFYCVPHTAPGGSWLFGGPSNAGGLFLDWAQGLLAPDPDRHAAPDPRAVPLWVPYPRGERVPLHDSGRRAQLHRLDLTHGPAAVRRAAFEAGAFVARRIIDDAPGDARRIVATGGGTRVEAWVRALADGTGLPVHVSAVPEGGALGAAFLGRVAAGLETAPSDAARWARTSHVVDPDPRWVDHAAERYDRFREIAG